MSRRSARFGAILAALLLPAVLFLNGCSASDEAEAQATPVPSAAPTEYIPASADGPAQNVPIPESYNEMQEFSEEGLMRGAQVWVEAVHYMAVTGDRSLLESLSMDECMYCSLTYETFEEIYENGGWVDSSGVYEFEILQTDFVEDDPTNYLAADLVALPEMEYSRDGKIVKENSSDQVSVFPVEMAMIFDEQEHRWKMHELVGVDEEELK